MELGHFLAMPGTVVILFHWSGPYQASILWANALLFLFFFDIFLIITISTMGFVVTETVFLGVIMAVPIMAGNFVGARILDPKKEGW